MINSNQLVTLLLAIVMIAVSFGVLSLNSVRSENSIGIGIVLWIFGLIGLITFFVQYISVLIEKIAHTQISLVHSFTILMGLLIIELLTLFQAGKLLFMVISVVSLLNLAVINHESYQLIALILSSLFAGLMYFIFGYLVYFGPLIQKMRTSAIFAIMRILFLPFWLLFDWTYN